MLIVEPVPWASELEVTATRGRVNPSPSQGQSQKELRALVPPGRQVSSEVEVRWVCFLFMPCRMVAWRPGRELHRHGAGGGQHGTELGPGTNPAPATLQLCDLGQVL